MRPALHLPAHRSRGCSKFLLALSLGVTAVIAGPLATGASAEVSPGCTATLAGQDVGSRSSTKASDAIDVKSTDQIVAGATSGAPIDGYKVQLEAGGFKWTVARGTASGNSWQRSVSIEDYASHGVGLYKVIGSSTGAGACTGAVLVNVKGKSPLTTTAGMVGMALTGIGAAGLAASGVRAARRRVPTGQPAHVIGLLALMALWMVGASPSGSTMAPLALAVAVDGREGVGWRPRLSLLGILTGAFGGLGVVVLLQQYAVAYPTRGLVLTGVMGGILLNLLTTNLVPLVLRRKPVAAIEPVVSQKELQEELQEELTAADETNLVDLAADPAWTPTHLVPAFGLAAWTDPDDSSGAPLDKLDPGLEVAVFEQDGTWAHIRCSNGWSAWVEAPQLVEIDR